MNRFVAKLATASARLAFWRKRVDAAPEQPPSPDPATVRRAKPVEAEPAAAVEAPAKKPGWFARLKHTLRKALAQESAPKSSPATIAEPPAAPPRPARSAVEAPATADAVAPAKLSLLARLKNTLSRQPKPAQPEAAAVSDKPAAEKAGVEKRIAAKPVEAPATADAVAPAKLSFFARLKNTLRRREAPARESAPESRLATIAEQPTAPARPARSAVEAPATADTAAPAKRSLFARLMRRQPKPAQPEAADVSAKAGAEAPSVEKRTAAKPVAEEDKESPEPGDAVPAGSFLARLKSKLRRQPAPETLAADAVAENPAAPEPATQRDRRATAMTEDDAADESEVPPVSLIGRLSGLLTNKWVWIPSVSMVILAFAGSMTWMLVQSKHEREQLQAKLASAQKQLKQASLEKQVALRQADPKPAPAVAIASASYAGSAAATPSGDDDGGCDVSSKESVAKNLKNCIEAFNSITAR